MIVKPFRLKEIMGRKSGRAALKLSDEQRAKLTELAASRTAPVREVERGTGYCSSTRKGCRSARFSGSRV